MINQELQYFDQEYFSTNKIVFQRFVNEFYFYIIKKSDDFDEMIIL